MRILFLSIPALYARVTEFAINEAIERSPSAIHLKWAFDDEPTPEQLLLSAKLISASEFTFITELMPTWQTWSVDASGFATGQTYQFVLESLTGLDKTTEAILDVHHVAKPDPITGASAKNIGELIQINWLAPNNNGSPLSKLILSVMSADSEWKQVA